jgi:hypothetical protein
MTTTADLNIIAVAEAAGTQAGQAAGTWVIDGNTDATTKAAIAKGIEDGDPLVLDAYATPQLVDGWLDLAGLADLTPAELVAGFTAEELDQAVEAYAMAAQTAFWGQVETEATQ